MIAGNYENKYDSKNPISILLVNNFLETIDSTLNQYDYKTLLEVGCGEGYLLDYLMKKNKKARYFGSDLSSKMVKLCQKKNSLAEIRLADACKLPYKGNSFDVVVLCEVLEHLNKPEMAIEEARRVSKQYCLFSVPNEPLWRCLNMLRFKYLTDWGNTPGHFNHWSRSSITNLVARHLNIVHVISPIPWTIILAKKQC